LGNSLVAGKTVNPGGDFELPSAHFLTGKIDCQYDCRFEKTAFDFIV
jgi:hypothetical protein